MSVGLDVKRCPVSRITTPLGRKLPFHWIPMKNFAISKRITFNLSRGRYMAEILPIWHKTLSNQWINQCRFCFKNGQMVKYRQKIWSQVILVWNSNTYYSNIINKVKFQKSRPKSIMKVKDSKCWFPMERFCH